MFTFRGKTQCVQEWANELGIGRDTIIARIDRYGWSVERAMTVSPLPRMLTFQGKTQSLTDWSKDLGIARSVITDRLSSPGWSIERTLSTPVKGNKKKA
jgi:hypothetical protein